MELTQYITVTIQTYIEFGEGVLWIGLADLIELGLVSDHAVKIWAEPIGDTTGLKEDEDEDDDTEVH